MSVQALLIKIVNSIDITKHRLSIVYCCLSQSQKDTLAEKNAESAKIWGQLSQERKEKYKEEATSSAVRFKEQSTKPQVEVSRIMRHLEEIVSINFKLTACV